MSVESPYAALVAATPVSERTVTVLGSETHYWTYGQADAPTTIVVVHGYRGEHHGLEPVIAHLRGIRIIAPDLPAFGVSTPMTEAPHSIDGYARWLAEFVETLGLGGSSNTDSAVILGHSFGSIVAAAAVAGGLETPRLILINPIAAPALRGPKAILTWLTVLYYETARILPDRAGRALLASPLIVRVMSSVMTETKDPVLKEWIDAQHDEYFSDFATPSTVVEGFHASIGSDVSEFAGRIHVPTLLIGAEKDPITRLSKLHELAENIEDSMLVVLPDVGHLIHYERPREAATAIVSFLGSGRVAAAIAPLAG
jgi:pimeloyl-ACP methyl ester carboxylesterase